MPFYIYSELAWNADYEYVSHKKIFGHVTQNFGKIGKYPKTNIELIIFFNKVDIISPNSQII